MTYLKRTNHPVKKGRRATFAIIFLLSFIFLIHYLFPSFYSSAISPAATVLWKAENNSTERADIAFGIIRSKHNLLIENKSLRRELAYRDSEALILNMLKDENESLKEALGRSAGGRDVLGVVLARPPITSYDTLVVDVGSSSGVSEGDQVYVHGAILIGDVERVSLNNATVSLFSAPGRVVPVLVGSSTVEVRAIGKGGGNFEAILPVELDIKVGDMISLPQLRTHVFGKVERIEFDSTDSLQTLLFKAPINMHEVRFVEIETQ